MKKKIIKTTAFMAGIFMTATSLFAASNASNNGLCGLIRQMKDVFGTLRVLAFIGAAFILASWAWDFIKGGDGKTNVIDALKAKGISMIVGFALLFAIGTGISFLMDGNAVGCAEVLTSKW
ncbi:MAG: hypothetical protein LBF28_02020 [Rickettsiales bacterium]|jgi:hypothetical protein|nr:hypothetical protein [Rickettsiales bacterium]